MPEATEGFWGLQYFHWAADGSSTNLSGGRPEVWAWWKRVYQKGSKQYLSTDGRDQNPPLPWDHLNIRKESSETHYRFITHVWKHLERTSVWSQCGLQRWPPLQTARAPDASTILRSDFGRMAAERRPGTSAPAAPAQGPGKTHRHRLERRGKWETVT